MSAEPVNQETTDPGKISPKTYTQDTAWELYAVALDRGTFAEVAEGYGIPERLLNRWRTAYPETENAIRAAWARTARTLAGGGALSSIVEDQINPDLLDLFEALQQAKRLPDRQLLQMDLATKGDTAKQRLLVHALIETGHNLSRAMRLLGITQRDLDRWTIADPDFARLWGELETAKARFVEGRLMDLVDQGDTKAVIFASESLNRDKYGKQIKVTGQVNHVHAHIDLTKLELDRETRVKLLEAIQRASKTDTDGLIVDAVTR